MKIAHFISNFPTNEESKVYGKSLAVYNLCLSLARMGHEISVHTVSMDRNNYKKRIDNITIYEHASLLGYKSERISFEILWGSFKNECDIVHIHSGISVALVAGYIFAKIKNKPLVITWHGDSIHEKKTGKYLDLISRVAAYFYNIILINKILSDANVIISVSQSYIHKSKTLKNYINKIIVIPNGTDFDDLQISSSKIECKEKLGISQGNVVFFLGSMYPLKGPDVLLRAVPIITKDNQDILFVLGGDGDIEKFEDLAGDLNIKEYVRFTGYLDNNTKKIYFKASDIFVLPSLTECFPLVNVEAMACGLPVIASDVGGVSDIVKHNINGYLVKPGNQNELASRITCLIDNYKTRMEFSNNAMKCAKEYSWNKIAELTEEAYTKLLH